MSVPGEAGGMPPLRVGVVAGEASGDQLGAGLIQALTAACPQARFEGVAGPAMRSAGCVAWEDAAALAVMGLVEPLAEIPRLLRLRRSLVRRWQAEPPDVFVGIDAPDFNLGLELALRRGGIPTVHYVSPTVWAWRAGRMRKIARAVDRVLCLFPFETALYDRHGVPATFVGHPLADRFPFDLEREPERRRLGLTASRIVAVLPGSRASEVARLGPVFAEASRRLVEAEADLGFVAPMAGPALRRTFAAQLAAAGVAGHYRLIDQGARSALAAADVCLLASGTAALEAALMARPMVAAYRVAPLTYLLARGLRLLKVRHITLPNLLTAEPLVPELLQGAATPAALADAVLSLLRDPDRRAFVEGEFAKLRGLLARGADREAARAVLALAHAGSDPEKRPNDENSVGIPG